MERNSKYKKMIECIQCLIPCTQRRHRYTELPHNISTKGATLRTFILFHMYTVLFVRSLITQPVSNDTDGDGHAVCDNGPFISNIMWIKETQMETAEEMRVIVRDVHSNHFCSNTRSIPCFA
eukprot:1006801_1